MNPINKKWNMMESENSIIYNAIVLTDESVQKLKKDFPPLHPNEFYHHVTLNFGKKQFPENLGEEVTFRVVGHAYDEKGQAVVVTDISSDNEVPHITLSCADGVKPVYSNELVKSGYDTIRTTKYFLTGVVKSYTKQGWI